MQRGDKGDQKLYKIPIEVWKAKQASRAAANMRGIGSQKAVKESITNASAAQLGSEAAGFVNSNIHVTGGDRIQGGGA